MLNELRKTGSQRRWNCCLCLVQSHHLRTLPSESTIYLHFLQFSVLHSYHTMRWSLHWRKQMKIEWITIQGTGFSVTCHFNSSFHSISDIDLHWFYKDQYKFEEQRLIYCQDLLNTCGRYIEHRSFKLLAFPACVLMQDHLYELSFSLSINAIWSAG